jgi:hypothetical protein
MVLGNGTCRARKSQPVKPSFSPLLWLAAVCLVLSACSDGDDLKDGVNPAAVAPAGSASVSSQADRVQPCLGCHEAIGKRWQKTSSHSLLLDCVTCHGAEPPGPSHGKVRACAECHSEKTHPQSVTCSGCHDVHGSDNLLLIREQIELPKGGTAAVTLTSYEGASLTGLARGATSGAQPGAGLCEVCHDATRYYRSTGDGEAHLKSWCGACHKHASGFSPLP